MFTTFFEFKLALFSGYLLAMALLIRWIINFAQKYDAASRWKRLTWLAPVSGLFLLLLAGTGLFDLPHYLDETKDNRRLAVRNFFGTLSILEYDANQPENHVYKLMHGKITHGIQYTDSDLRYVPTTYYGETSGAGPSDRILSGTRKRQERN